MRFARFVRGLFALCLGSPGAVSLSAIELHYAVPEGTIGVHLPTEAEGWVCEFPEKVGDLLFPDGVTLASMREKREPAGIMATVSLDATHPIPPAEQAAFIALARDREKDGRMAVWELGEHVWIVQEFQSPSERVLAVQTFLGPYALAYLFWFETGGEASIQFERARSVLKRWYPYWKPAPVDDPESPDQRRESPANGHF